MQITGTIVRLVVDKRFGFIRRTGGGELEYFFHASAVEGSAFEQLREGLAVTFEEVSSAKGPRANRVIVA